MSALDAYFAHLANMDFDNFLALPQGVQDQILNNLNVNDLLTFHSFLDNGVNSKQYRRVIEWYFRRKILEELGGEGLAHIETVPNVAPLSYVRHMYLAFLAARNALRYTEDYITLRIIPEQGDKSYAHIDIYAGELEAENVEIGVSVYQTRELMQRVIMTEDYFSRRIADFLNIPAELIDREDNHRTYLYNGIQTNLLELTRIAFFIIHVLGARVTELGVFGTDKYIRSCISCSANEAKHMCECHKKEYCSQECANKDH